MVTDDLTDRSTLRAAANALQSSLARHAAQIDAEAAFPVESLQQMRTSGLLGLLVPAEYGGPGGSLADLVDVAQILASGCLSTAMIWAMHCQQVDAVMRFGSPELRADLLPLVARGEAYLGSITTESRKGGHLMTAVAALESHGGALELDRDAPIVTGGEYADGFLVTMRMSKDSAEGRVSLVYVDRQQADVKHRTQTGWDPLGMRGTRSAGLHIRGRVPHTHVVGPAGGFRTVATESMIVTAHLGWAACWLGAARSALADLVGLLRSAKRPSGLELNSPLTAERLARIRMELELVGGYLNRVTEEVVSLRADGRSVDNTASQIHLNVLKVAAAELTFSAVDRMIRLAGLGAGYLKTSTIPLERHFRDLRSASLNNSDDRLLVATGALTLMDRTVRLA